MSQVIAVISDLIFRSKVDATARSVGADVRVVPSSRALLDAMRGLDAKDVTVLVDLGLPGSDALEAIRSARKSRADAKVIAFGSHVDQEALQSAADAGADQVMTRSQFTADLEQIISNAAG